MVLNHGLGWENYDKVARIFHLNAEQSIPAYFSTVLLLFSSILLWIIGLRASGGNVKWKILSVIFLLMSVDEMASLHEKLIPLVRHFIGENQFFYWGWTLPAGLFLVAFGIYFFPFWKNLPSSTRTGMMWAGIIYVGGALVLEFFESLYFYEIKTYKDVWLDLMILFEEIMEMAGIIIFIRTLLLHIRNHISLDRIDFAEQGQVI